MKMLEDMLKELEHQENVLETKIQRMLEESDNLADQLIEIGRARKKLKTLLEADNVATVDDKGPKQGPPDVQGTVGRSS